MSQSTPFMPKSGNTNEEITYTTNLRHLAIETCRHMNLHVFLGFESLVVKISYMIQSGANIELVGADLDGYVLCITGVRVVIKDGVPNCTLDPSSFGKLKVLDCGHKLCCTAIIGSPRFSHSWDGQRCGETISDEPIKVFRENLIQLAYDIECNYQDTSGIHQSFAGC